MKYLLILIFVLASCSSKKLVTAQTINETKKEITAAKSYSVATTTTATTQNATDQSQTATADIVEKITITYNTATGKPIKQTIERQTHHKRQINNIDNKQTTISNTNIEKTFEAKTTTNQTKKDTNKTTEKKPDWVAWLIGIPFILVVAYFSIRFFIFR